MRIVIYFHFDSEDEPQTSTGVSGDVADIVLPNVGDTVRHADFTGTRLIGRVRSRTFHYQMAQGEHVDGTISITLMLEEILVQ